MYNTERGKAACIGCDRIRIEDILVKGKTTAPQPYECHAGLIDFCQPIVSQIGGKRKLIGIFFAGQVLYEKDEITEESIHRLRELASSCKVNPEELLARYIQVPRLSRKRIGEIRTWMEQFSHLLGLMVERKATTQQLLLDVIRSADDPNAIVQAVQRHLQPAAVSIFMQRDNVPERFADRIFLIATTFKELRPRLSIEEEDNIGKISYQRGEGLTGWVYKTGRILHISDVRDKNSYPKYHYLPEWKHKVKEIPQWQGLRAFLGVPIGSDDGKVIGVIRAARLEDDPGFKNDEVELLKGIASLVGAAVSKAQLYKKHVEKVEALNQAQGLLNTLTEPDTNLESITNSMVEELGKTYVKKGKWEAVYVLQHLKSSRQFQFVASFPANLANKYKGAPFPDTEGIEGHMLKTRRCFASRNCITDGVEPTTPWTSVISAPIIHENKMWGAVSLCSRRERSQTDVDLASPKITEFAKDMSLVCRLSEILDAQNAVTIAASNVLSMNLEAHEVYKSLESSKIMVDRLSSRIKGDEKDIVEDLAKQIRESLSWADVCLELGRYIRQCQMEPESAVQTFRRKHLLVEKRKKAVDTLEHRLEEVGIIEVARRALESVKSLINAHKTKITLQLTDGGCVVGDENLLYRALRNLLENAIVHGSRVLGNSVRFKKGVRVTFSVRRDSKTRTTSIVIKDEGIGMDPKILAASKEIYANPTLLGVSSLAPGFGTTIVAFAISVHEGRISLKSKPKGGTIVSLEIPSYRKGES